MDEFSFIKHETSLPTPSPVLRRIGAAAESADASMHVAVEALRSDPVMAGKVLRLANSAYTGMPRKISSLKNAAGLLGLKRIRSLVIAARIGGASGDTVRPPDFLDKYWRHSTLIALIAESICRHRKRYDPLDEQEIFSAALLHDIGKLALAVHDPDRVMAAIARSRRESLPFYKTEDAGKTHTGAGGRLAGLWGFPPDLSAAIAGHHDPMAQGHYAHFVAIVHVADIMAHILGYSAFDGEAVPLVDERALGAVRLPPERLKVIAETELENHRRIEALCGMFQGC